MKHLGFYNDKTEMLELVDWRTVRNNVIGISFIVSVLFCFFKNYNPFTLKNAIFVWIIILVGEGIRFILSDVKKRDDDGITMKGILDELEKNGQCLRDFCQETSELIKNEASTENPSYQKILEKLGELKPSDTEIAYKEIKDFYNTLLEKRKMFTKEIIEIIGLIVTLLGSAFLEKYL